MKKNNQKINQILQDPVAAYGVLDNDVDKAAIASLTKLGQLYLSTLNEQKFLDDEIKSLSRQIGQAKKQNRPSQELISKTRNLSIVLKHVSNRLNTTISDILEYFDISKIDEIPKGRTSYNKQCNDYENTPRVRYKIAPNNTKTTIKFHRPGEKDSITAELRTQWNLFVENHSAGTIHHSFEWCQIHKDTYNIDSYFFYASSEDGTIQGILPVTHLKSRLFGNLMVSMPFFQRGGAIANCADIENSLIKAADENAESLNIQHIEYRDDIRREQMPALEHKVNMVLKLPETADVLWNNFSAKLRAQIKRPQRENPQKHIGGLDLLDDFYAVYTRNMRDLGSPAHSRLYIENILKAFPENSWLVVVRYNKEPVAAALLLAVKETMEIPLASTIKDFNHLSINMFLYWEILQFAIEGNYKYFDFGRSTIDAGTYRFKKQWGAQPLQLYWHYWLNGSAQIPSLNPSNPKYSAIIHLWKRIPVRLSQWLGPLIVKNLP